MKSVLQGIIEEQRRAVRLQSYDVLGRLQFAKITRGTATLRADFGKSGPLIARDSNTGNLLVVTPWQGLPDLRGNSERVCKACAVECDECTDGVRGCIYPGCGGRGYLLVNEKACPDCVTPHGKFNPECKTCNGRGAVPDPTDCPCCKKSGKQKCDLCRGTGKMASGRVDGKICGQCGGHGRAAKMQPQPLEPLISGTIEGMTAIGPISELVWAVERQGEAKFVQCRIYPDANGMLMAMLLERPAPGADAFLLGGKPTFE